MLSRWFKCMTSKTLRIETFRSASNYDQRHLTEREKKFTKEIEPNPDFFNRNAEIEALRANLEGPKMLTILKGPPDCGKTRLINEILRDYTSFTTVSANLRLLGLSKNQSFAYFMANVFNDHIDYSNQIKGDIKKLTEGKKNEAEFSAGPIKKIFNLGLGVKYQNYCDIQKQIDLNEMSSEVLFKRLTEVIEGHYNAFGSCKTLVIFIDEFNNIKKCPDDKLIDAILASLIAYSKEKQKVQVILSTADSFITNYLSSAFKIRSWQYNILELDWISHDETLRYLEYKQVPKEFHEKIYYYFGGDFLRIDLLLSHCTRNNELKISDEQIEELIDSYCMNFNRDMDVKIADLSPKEKEILLIIFKRLIDENMLYQDTLEKEFSKKIIKKFLSLNLFYLKTGMLLTSSHEKERRNRSMITFNLPFHKFAIKNYLENMEDLNN